MPKVRDIARTIEGYAPLSLQESYDNCGLQVGNPDMEVSGCFIVLDVTEQSVSEAVEHGCNMVISHHPLIFGGIKSVTASTSTGRIVLEAARRDVAIYSAHTNLDKTYQGVSWEMACMLSLTDVEVLDADEKSPLTGLGTIGNFGAMPSLEFLRKVKECFGVKALKYSAGYKSLIVKRVAVCGGSGASLIKEAVKAGADAIVTGDVKYHDFTEWGDRILIVDIGHFESELGSRKILSQVLEESYPDLPRVIDEEERNPINFL